MSALVNVNKLIQVGKNYLIIPTWRSFNTSTIPNLTKVKLHLFNRISRPKLGSFCHNKPFLKGLEPKTFVTQKDVVLYSNENIKFFRVLNAFSFSQCMFWIYLSNFAYTSMKHTGAKMTDEQVKSAVESGTFIPLWRKLDLGKYKTAMCAISVIIGVGCAIVTLLYTKSSIRYLTLKRGGEQITFEFFTLFGKGRQKTVSINDISARNSRQNAKSYVVLKLRNSLIHLILDSNGQFHNKQLFDKTVGLQRAWAK